MLINILISFYYIDHKREYIKTNGYQKLHILLCWWYDLYQQLILKIGEKSYIFLLSILETYQRVGWNLFNEMNWSIEENNRK